MRHFLVGAVFLLVTIASLPAHAYGGPGAAITALGAVAAFGSAIVFAFTYGVLLPLKRSLVNVFRRSRPADPDTESGAD